MAAAALDASPGPTTAAQWLTLVDRYAQDGEFFKAYDVALQGLGAHAGDARLRHRAVLCLANAGALDLARRRFRELGLDARDDVDSLTLDARLAKSEAEGLVGEARRQRLRAAADRYMAAWRLAQARSAPDAYYPGINVATLRLLTGERDQAETIAAGIARDLERRIDAPAFARRADAYWILATAIEARLVLGDVDGARRFVAPALSAGAGRHAELASTARQLRRIAAALGLDVDWLSAFAPPDVAHYTGHILANRALAEDAVAADLARLVDGLRLGAAYGSLAAGCDILFAEALLARGVGLNVVLPFAVDDFVAQSVAPSGAAWVARFERCLALATTVRFATEDRYLGDDALYAHCSRLAMGLAVLCARHLGATARQLAVWDGRAPAGPAGTAADLALWRGIGLPQAVVDCGAAPPVAALDGGAPPGASHAGRRPRAMLFGDIKGFSRLTDAQIPPFAAHVLGALGRVIDTFASDVALVNTWGDGLFVVFDEPGAAARCALALQQAMAGVDLAACGLPPTLALRIGGHFGPVYRVDDPVLHRSNYLGAHVSRAARIEPITPEGCVYVTETFAAALALSDAASFSCDYVGITEMAKAYGPMRMFLLRRAGADGPATLRPLH
jgi:hypothetical protein